MAAAGCIASTFGKGRGLEWPDERDGRASESSVNAGFSSRQIITSDAAIQMPGMPQPVVNFPLAGRRLYPYN